MTSVTDRDLPADLQRVNIIIKNAIGSDEVVPLRLKAAPFGDSKVEVYFNVHAQRSRTKQLTENFIRALHDVRSVFKGQRYTFGFEEAGVKSFEADWEVLDLRVASCTLTGTPFVTLALVLSVLEKRNTEVLLNQAF